MNDHQILFVDQIGLSIKEEERSPALPLTEEHVPTSGRAVKGSTKYLESQKKLSGDMYSLSVPRILG